MVPCLKHGMRPVRTTLVYRPSPPTGVPSRGSDYIQHRAPWPYHEHAQCKVAILPVPALGSERDGDASGVSVDVLQLGVATPTDHAANKNFSINVYRVKLFERFLLHVASSWHTIV